MRSQLRALRRSVFAVLTMALAACGQNLVGPAGEACGGDPHFTAIPVALGDIEAIAVVGGLGAPGHTLPTAHTGFILRTEGAEVRSPGAIQITKLRRTRYITSPNRQGHEDYTAEFQVCKDISGWFGHLSSLSTAIPVPDGGWKECERYSTALESIESCTARVDKVSLTAGQPMGTSGFSIALGLMGLDFGLLDARVTNAYVARWRFPEPVLRSVCPWERFDATIKAQLYTKLRDLSGVPRASSGEPRCGTMVVDVAGTAKGVWALPSITEPVQGNETGYITLANYPYQPEAELALSLGPDILGATVLVVPRATEGRVNRPFEQVTPDGLIYCYAPAPGAGGFINILLMMTGPSELMIRKVPQTAPNMCSADPSTWTMAGATRMVR